MKNRNVILGVLLIMSLAMSSSLFAQGHCLNFDGTNDFVDCGNGSSLNITGTISIEAWIYPTDFKDASWKSTIVSNDNWSGATSEGYVFRYGDTDGDLDFTFAYAGGYNWASTTAEGVLILNTWQHVAVTYNNIEVLLYVNGEEVHSENYSYSIVSSVKNVNIGRAPGDIGGRCLEGKIEDVRIWNDVRTQTEIQNNMNNELTGAEDNLVAYYKFNEGSGQTAGDSAGDNDGTLGSTIGSDSDDPSWIVSDAPLPVTLSSFTATFSEGSSLLSWTTQSETNNLGWNVYRSETENVEDYTQINSEMIEGAGTTTEQTDYTFADENETYANNSYWYWIESVDNGGTTTLHGPARIDIPDTEDELPPELLTSYGLAQNFPNPFNPNTKIAFKITEVNTKNAKLIIYNPKGQIVKIFDDLTTNGDELGSVTWNGDNENGNAVSSGMYFYKLITDEKVYSKKMMMLK